MICAFGYSSYNFGKESYFTTRQLGY